MEFGALTGYARHGQTVRLEFANGRVEITAVTDGILRVTACGEAQPPHSFAIEGDKTLPAALTVWQAADGLYLETGRVRARVSDGFYVDFFDAAGTLVCADCREKAAPLRRLTPEGERLLQSEGHAVPGAEEEMPVQAAKVLPAGAHVYGLGDKTGFLDKRGYDYVMWNTDDPKPHVDTFKALYKSIPFLIVQGQAQVYGLFFDNPCRSTFDIGKTAPDCLRYTAAGGVLDYYYLAGADIPQVVESYTYLTGRCPLPQKWTLGYHQSRWGYVSQEDVAAVAERLRADGIPCDAIHFDIDYMDGYRVFTWDEKKYHGDPAAFLAKLREKGFKPVTIIDPGVKKDPGYRLYDEAAARGYFAKTPDGKDYVNRVWPGDALYPDFGRAEVRAWWARQHTFLTELGVRGVWDDMNEPASFDGPLPDDVVFWDEDTPSDHAHMHNVYGHLMAKATYAGMKAADGLRPFVITRACYAGTQKYATAWTGDNTSMWGHLQMLIPQLCNLGLSGMPFVGTDIGGFGGDTTPELMARWVEAACFSPLLRNHSAMGTRFQEPWQFGAEVEAIYRRYVRLRYRLIPYLYDLFYAHTHTGAPVMRPLVFHYGQDRDAQSCNDEFLVGDRLLVAPVVTQGSTKRLVYLPEGTWYDYWTRERHTGGRWIIRDAPLTVCPMYVKAGSVLPMAADQAYVGEKPDDVLLLDVFPGEGTYLHYHDNGADFAYTRGEYDLYRFTVHGGTVQTELLHGGFAPYREIRILHDTQK